MQKFWVFKLQIRERLKCDLEAKLRSYQTLNCVFKKSIFYYLRFKIAIFQSARFEIAKPNRPFQTQAVRIE